MRRSLALVLAALAFGVATSPSAVAGEPLPYRDESAIGDLTLCSKALKPVMSGKTYDRPFALRAVSSAPAPSGYTGEGRLATLHFYQPREGIAPGAWSGEQLTGPTSYSNPLHPMAQETDIDYALDVYLERFPTRWQGLIQLRMYFGIPGRPTSPLYAAMDLRVQGQAWSVVRGGSAPCADGTAKSAELLLPDFQQRLATTQAEELKRAGARAAVPGHPSTAPSSAPSGSAGTSAASSTGSAATGQSSATSSSPASKSTSLVWLVAVAAAVLAAAARLARRRSRA